MVERIGIIGLGLVGQALAGRLAAAGVKVSGFDIVGEQCAMLSAQGGVALSSAEEVAGRHEVVVLSLPTLAQSAQVLNQILPCLRAGSIVVDTTTGDPEQSAGLSAMLSARNVFYLECLIGGSSTLVRAGDAIAMCGGDRAAFERCEALLKACFQPVHYLGAPGNGSRMKLVLNLVLGLNRAVLAEGLAFAEACGLDAAMALDILRGSPAYSRVMDTKGRRMVESNFEPEARLSQHLKDVRIIRELGAKNGARLPLSELHSKLLEEVEAAGHGAADNSAIVYAYREENLG